MIPEFVAAWEQRKSEVRAVFESAHPAEYIDIVRAVVGILTTDTRDDGTPDPDRIHVIDDGDYSGTLLFVVAENGYQPMRYWAVRVSYGSCSGCDTLECIRHHRTDVAPTAEQVRDYMTLALHIVHGFSEINGEVA